MAHHPFFPSSTFLTVSALSRLIIGFMTKARIPIAMARCSLIRFLADLTPALWAITRSNLSGRARDTSKASKWLLLATRSSPGRSRTCLAGLDQD